MTITNPDDDRLGDGYADYFALDHNPDTTTTDDDELGEGLGDEVVLEGLDGHLEPDHDDPAPDQT
jgi:hypothetical protein